MHVLSPDGTRRVGAEAVQFVYEELGYRSAALLGLPGVRSLARLGYRWVASNRIAASKLFFRTPE